MEIQQTLSNIALVAAGGALGAVCRFGVQNLTIIQDNSDKYLYTVAVNIIGCFLIGVLWSCLNGFNIARGWHLFLISGLLGGFTTYSSFALDANLLIQNGMYIKALICMFGTFFGGILACLSGLKITEFLMRGI